MTSETLTTDLEPLVEQLRATRSVVTLANLAVTGAEDTGETENMSDVRQSLEHVIERMTAIEEALRQLWARRMQS